MCFLCWLRSAFAVASVDCLGDAAAEEAID